MKTKERKPEQIRTASFILRNDAPLCGKAAAYPWCIHHRVTRRNPNADPDAIIGTVSFTEPDAWKCIDMSISFSETLEKKEYAELLTAIIGNLPSALHMEKDPAFVSVSIPQESEMKAAMDEIGFTEDPADPGKLLYEHPVMAAISIYMCLGISLGVALGSANGNTAVGMCIGIAIGVSIGIMLQSSLRKKRDKLREARTARVIPEQS